MVAHRFRMPGATDMVVEADDPIGRCHHHVQIMRDHQHAAAAPAADAVEKIEQLGLAGGVEILCRLVEHERLSGSPSLINTSFNMHEEPIVCSPMDALRAFLDGRIDGLALGPFFVANPRTKPGMEN